jgi:hypothetical protein
VYIISESNAPEIPNQSGTQPFPLPLFAAQLQNIVPVDIVALRFPGSTDNISLSPDAKIGSPTVQLNIEEPLLNSEMQQAQVVMNTKKCQHF